MIVQCPNCQTKYNLPDDKINPEGSQVRCTRCLHVFTVAPPPSDEDLDYLLGGEPAEEPQQPREESFETSLPEEPGVSAEEEEAGEAFPGVDLPEDEDLGLALEGKSTAKAKKKGGGRKVLLLVLLLFLLVSAGAGAGLWYLGMIPPELLPSFGEQPQEPAQPVNPADAVKNIQLENVRQYYVNNEKAGQLFVIEGKAVNNFASPKEFIKVQATLFDGEGKALSTQELLCGNILSYFQLQILSRDEIEANIGSEVGVLNNNTNLAQGMGSPFMIIFFDPPQTVAEFGVKVIEAKDPPKE